MFCYHQVYRRPWISCPADVSVDLPPSQGTYILGFKWVLPKSNMKNVAVSPSHLSESYPFPAGKTRVTWTATNDNGDLKMCYYYVTVNGQCNVCSCWVFCYYCYCHCYCCSFLNIRQTCQVKTNVSNGTLCLCF